MKISQCMIVKNEEKNIERALSWGKGIVDEQIVVDTGSTDRTREIAEQMGAKVYEFAWINDFSAAKNFAIEQASGDWIFFLDADEYFIAEEIVEIRRNLEYLLKHKMQAETGEFYVNVISCQMAHLGENGKVKSMQRQARIFRNLPYLRYHGVIHEALGSTGDEATVGLDVGEGLVIYHTGYMWSDELIEEKSRRNIELLQKELERRPDSAETQLYLAEILGVKKENAEAYRYAKMAAENRDGSLLIERLTIAYQIMLYKFCFDPGDEEETIEEVYAKACSVNPNMPDFDLAMGFYMFDQCNWQSAVFYLKAALEKADKSPYMENSRVMELLNDIYKKLCMSYEELGSVEKSFYYASLCLEVNPYQDEMLYPLVYKLTYTRPAPAADILALLEKYYDLSSRKDVLFVLKSVKRAGNQELEKALEPYLTEEDRILLYGNA